MFGLASRRLGEAVIGLFALLGFALVPLGRKTALEHARDIFTTPAAENAWQELGGAAGRLREKLTAAFLSPTARVAGPGAEPQPEPKVPAFPREHHADKKR